MAGNTARRDAEAFVNALEAMFGQEDHIEHIEATKPGLRAVRCLCYRDLPEKGILTAVMHAAVGK
jgi:hypothetical protein